MELIIYKENRKNSRELEGRSVEITQNEMQREIRLGKKSTVSMTCGSVLGDFT